jgi:tRNA-intron endonuclease, archaea type
MKKNPRTKKQQKKGFEITFNKQEFSSNKSKAFELKERSYFGEKKEDTIIYSAYEAVYLTEKNKAKIIFKQKNLIFKEIVNKLAKKEKDFLTNYIVFKDLRDKGYILKTALKFGAEFRVYEKGASPKKKHAKWLLFPISKSKQLTKQDFIAKNRIAHSIKKNLLIAIIDDEQDIIYYEIKWIKI